MDEDLRRELEKIEEALELAVRYHSKTNEANAALHKSGRVLYSPMTISLMIGLDSVRKLLGRETQPGPRWWSYAEDSAD